MMGTILFVLVSWISSISRRVKSLRVLVRRSGSDVGPFIPKKPSESRLVSLFEHSIFLASATFLLNYSSLLSMSFVVMRNSALSTAMSS